MSPMLHPVIRVVLFFVFATFAAYGQITQLLAQAVLLLTFFSFRPQVFTPCRRVLWRMRWLFLSICVVYLGFTPGLPLIPAWESSPSILGAQLATMRVGALILIIMALQVLLQGLPREDLVAAVLWLLYPFRWLVDDKKLAIRIGLTLQLLGEVSLMNRLAIPETRPDASKTGLIQRINNISDRISALFASVLEKALTMPAQTLEIPDKNSPPVSQWAFPLLLCLGFVALDWERWLGLARF